MEFKLERPLVFFDLETTGLRVAKDKIVQIAMIKIFPDGKQISHQSLINPGIPIPKEASEIHGITDDAVIDAPLFQRMASKIGDVLKDSDIAGYNSDSFDIPFLQREMQEAGVELDLYGVCQIDVLSIFRLLVPKTLVGAMKFFCNEDFSGDAHNAMADVEATIKVLNAQIKANPDILPRSIPELQQVSNPEAHLFVDSTKKFKWDDDDEATIAFGKLNGMKLRVAVMEERPYLEWMLSANFPANVKKAITDGFAGFFPKRSPDTKTT